MSGESEEFQLLLQIWSEISDDQKEKLLDEAIRLRHEPTLLGGPVDGFCPRDEAWNGIYTVSLGNGRVAIYEETDIGSGRFVFQGTKRCGEGMQPNCFPEMEGGR